MVKSYVTGNVRNKRSPKGLCFVFDFKGDPRFDPERQDYIATYADFEQMIYDFTMGVPFKNSDAHQEFLRWLHSFVAGLPLPKTFQYGVRRTGTKKVETLEELLL